MGDTSNNGSSQGNAQNNAQNGLQNNPQNSLQNNAQNNIDLEIENAEVNTEGTGIPLQSYNSNKKKKITMTLAIAAFILTFVLGFLLKGFLVNQFMLLTKTPAQYYAYIEHKSTSSGIDFLTNTQEASSAKNQKTLEDGIGTSIVADLSISPEYAGLYGLSDIGSINLNSKVYNNGLNASVLTALSYKDQSLVNLKLLYDVVNSLYYMQLPELSSAYLKYEVTQNVAALDGNSSHDMEKLQNILYGDSISTEEYNQLLSTYTDIVITGLTNVTQNSDATLSISDSSRKYTSLTVNISANEIYDIAVNILTAAKSDELLQDIVVKEDLWTIEEYTAGIDEALQSLENKKESFINSTKTVLMTVYVNDFGAIMGREFNFSESTNHMGYYFIREGLTIDFKAFTELEHTPTIHVTGNGTYSNKKISGKSIMSIEKDAEVMNVTLEYSDFEKIKNTNHINGTVSLTSDQWNGIAFGLDLIGSSEEQQMNFNMQYGNLEGVTLNIATKEIPYEDMILPGENQEVYNISQNLNGYMESMDLFGFIEHIQEVTGINWGRLLFGASLY